MVETARFGGPIFHGAVDSDKAALSGRKSFQKNI
jgi:hypothetical protein